MRVLITGGAGFIAYHLAAALIGRQAEVSLLDNFNNFYDPEIKRRNVRDLQAQGRVPLHTVDILDRERLRQVFEEVRPDTVVHLAAWAGVRPSLEKPDLYSSVNVTGTVNLLEMAKEFSTRCFIFGSSSSVYGGNTKVPFSEEDPVDRPVSPYAATKRAGELLCHTYAHNFSMHITCLRFFTVYGPRQRPEMAIHKFAQLMAAGERNPDLWRRRLPPGLHLCGRYCFGCARSHRRQIRHLKSSTWENRRPLRCWNWSVIWKTRSG